MARVEIPVSVINGSTGLPIEGAAVTVTRRSNGAAVTWYSTEVGGSGSTAAIITDDSGRVNAWVERGAYNLNVTGTGITPYTEAWDAAPAGDATLDALWLPDDTVTTSKIANDTVTNPKIVTMDAAKLTGTMPSARIAPGAITGSQLAAATVAVSNLATGSASRVLGAAVLAPFNIAANGSATLGTVTCSHNGKPGWAFVIHFGIGNATVTFSMRIRFDGAIVNTLLNNIGNGEYGTWAGAYNYSAPSVGDHTWTVTIDFGNTPGSMTAYGNGLLVVMEDT